MDEITNRHLIKEAIDIVNQFGRPSTKMLQDRLLIGYNRACAIIKHLEKTGVIRQIE